MNQTKFNGKANVYAKYRPSYPVKFLDYLYSEVGLTEDSVIADVGSGTGIFTGQLLKRRSFVYGVEPNGDMRSVAENAFGNYANFKSVNTCAEDTGLPGGSVDFITVAQAFHWFDRTKFRLECARILKESGKVVLVWNSRDSQSELVCENDKINRKYCPEFKGFSGGRRGEFPEVFSDFFKDGHCEYRVFRNDLAMYQAGFIGRNLSGSYAPKETDENYAPYVLALKELYDKYSNGGIVIMPNITRSYIGEI